MNEIRGKRVAILAADGFEEAELTEPRKALQEAGAETKVVSPASGRIQGMHHLEKGTTVAVDLPLQEAKPDDFDALMLPGGALNPDTLRVNPTALEFVRGFFAAGKPVAAICHAGWVLADAGVLQGRKVTSWPAIRNDIQRAGAHWVDEPVVVDNGLVTSRMPADIPAFNSKMIEEISEGIHDEPGAARVGWAE